MNRGTLAQQIEATRRRVVVLHHQVGNAASPPHQVIEKAFGELETTLDELSIAEEEVQQQNEELAAAREALEAERQRYQDLFEFAPDAYLVTDTGGAIQEANRAAAELLGVPNRWLLGKPLTRFVAAEERRRFRSRLNRLLQAGPAASRPADATQAGHTVRQEWAVSLRPRHGASFDAALTVAAVHDRDGRPVALRWLLRDVTERKRDETALRESEARKRAILATALDGIITIDHDGRIVEWNPAAEKMFGYRRAEVVGKQMGALIVPPAHREAHERGLAHYLATGEGAVLNRRIEITAVRADGTEFPVELAITRIPCGGPPMFTGFVRDITQRQQMEAALQERAEALVKADRAKDQFLAMLAHELRNPIEAISNALHLLKLRSGDDPRMQRPLEIMERQVEHQARMLEDLLNVSRIARGKITLNPRRLDLMELVRGIAEDHRNALEAAGLDLVLELPAGPVWLNADPTRLAQSVANLLENARKFTDRGGRVTVRVETEGTQARVTIQDTGIGIEPALLPVIFESFIQGERTLDRSGGGLGLGLALVKGLVELHGGEVQAASGGIGCGTAVTLRLPVAPAPLAAAAVPPAVPVSAGPSRILVVEDNRDAAEALCGLLEASGCTVAVAYSGLEAVESARQFRPEVVLSDLGLPGMDGYQLAQALRRDPSLATTRLIAISGYGQEQDQRRSQAAGFDGHLTKPIDFEELQRLMGISPV